MSHQNVSCEYLSCRVTVGLFQLCLRYEGTMLTKIFHPNMSKSGEICVDTLKKGWKKEYGVGHVLVVSKYLEALRARRTLALRLLYAAQVEKRESTVLTLAPIDDQMLVDIPEPGERAG